MAAKTVTDAFLIPMASFILSAGPYHRIRARSGAMARTTRTTPERTSAAAVSTTHEEGPGAWTATKHEKLGHVSRSDQKSYIYVALKVSVPLRRLLRLCLLPCSVYATWQYITKNRAVDFMMLMASM